MTRVHALQSVAIIDRSAAPIADAEPAVPRARLRAAFSAASDLVALLAVVFSLPFIVLAVGTPIAAALMALLWVIRSL